MSGAGSKRAAAGATSRKAKAPRAAVAEDGSVAVAAADGAAAAPAVAAAAAAAPLAKKPRAPRAPPAAPSPHVGPAPTTDGAFAPAASMGAFTASLAPRPAGATLKVLVWNVNGLRAAFAPDKRADVLAWLAREDADVICLQVRRQRRPATAAAAR